MTPSPLFARSRSVKRGTISGLNLGGLLPTRIARSTGSVVNVGSMAALLTAVNSTAANGQIINLTASYTGTGANDIKTITRNATALAPITITCDPGVLLQNFGGFDVRGSYLRFMGLEFYNNNSPNLSAGCSTINPNSGAHHIEIEKCKIYGLFSGNNLSNGIYLGSGAGDNIQIWDCVIYYVGRANGLDHGIYWSTSPSNGVIANCLIYDPYSYGVQLYPNIQGLIMTCCTIDGGQTTMADPRGGVVIGDEDGTTTHDVKVVGCIVSNAPGAPAFHSQHGGLANNVYDCISYNNPQGDFDTGWWGGGSGHAITYTNCVVTNPLYVNRGSRDYRLQAGSPAINFINSARYGYIPPLDINGNPRITADAGAYAA